jgi:hypothetical protein
MTTYMETWVPFFRSRVFKTSRNNSACFMCHNPGQLIVPSKQPFYRLTYFFLSPKFFHLNVLQRECISHSKFKYSINYNQERSWQLKKNRILSRCGDR